MALKKVLKIGEPYLFNRVNLYVFDNGAVRYKHIDGKRFESLEVFREEYRRHFKKEVNLNE